MSDNPWPLVFRGVSGIKIGRNLLPQFINVEGFCNKIISNKLITSFSRSFTADTRTMRMRSKKLSCHSCRQIFLPSIFPNRLSSSSKSGRISSMSSICLPSLVCRTSYPFSSKIIRMTSATAKSSSANSIVLFVSFKKILYICGHRICHF